MRRSALVLLALGVCGCKPKETIARDAPTTIDVIYGLDLKGAMILPEGFGALTE